MLRESFTLIAFLGASFLLNWRLTLGSLLIAPPIAGLTMRFGSSLRKLARESFEGSKRLTDTAQEALANQSIVKGVSRAKAARGDRFARSGGAYSLGPTCARRAFREWRRRLSN